MYPLVCGCIAAGQNKSPAPSADARQKKSPASVSGVEMGGGSALAVPNVIISCGHDGIAATDLNNNAITGASLACIVTGGIQSGHNIKTFIGGSHNVNPPYFDALNSAEKNQKKNKIVDKIIA